MSEFRYEHLDRLIRAQLGDWEGAADALDDWLFRKHRILSSSHGLGLLLDLLADAGYTVVPADRLADTATPPSPDSSLPAGWQAPEDFDG